MNEAEEAEEVYPEVQEPQEFEVAEQVDDQALEPNFANPDLQQGKHRFMLKPELLHSSLILYLITYAFKLIELFDT